MNWVSMACVTGWHNVTTNFISFESFTPPFRHLSATSRLGSMMGGINGLPRIGTVLPRIGVDKDLASIACVIAGTGVGVFSIINRELKGKILKESDYRRWRLVIFEWRHFHEESHGLIIGQLEFSRLTGTPFHSPMILFRLRFFRRPYHCFANELG
jgi:hypothetical protein